MAPLIKLHKLSKGVLINRPLVQTPVQALQVSNSSPVSSIFTMTNTSKATQNGTGRQARPPSSNSTRSYWHRDPSDRLLGHRTTELPTTADVVIIGSGITGTFAARELVAGGRSVLMLEAREACWGATGRVSPSLPILFVSLIRTE